MHALTGRAPELDLDDDRAHLFADRRGPGDVVEWPGRISMGLSLGGWSTSGRSVRPADHLDASLDRSWPSSMVPPFGALVRRSPGEPFVAATDACGLRHVHFVVGDGWAGCSTSSLVLAAVAGALLDADASTVAALAGHQLGDRTPFEGVRRLGAGHRLELWAGHATPSTFVAPRPRDPRSEAPTTASSRLHRGADEGAAVMARSVGQALEAHPGAGLELSGGLDSRMLLAAVPEDLRVGRWALTLAAPGNPDVAVARRLAALAGLDHEVVDLSELARLGPDEALELVRRAALRRDATTDPVAGAVLDFVSHRTEGRALLTGQNGEFARGYYYPGQPTWPRATPELVRYLAHWRIFTAAPVDGALFGRRLPEVRRRAVAELESRLRMIGGRWPEATDELYLAVRMQNWVGRDFSVAATERQVVAPFFHPAFLAWAREARRRDKAGSRLFATVLERLDPRLAASELDVGVRPTDLAHPSLPGRVASLGRAARKALRKASLRAAPGSRAVPPVGAATLAASVRQAWAADDGALSRVASLDFLDAGVVEGVASGRRRAGPATVGFLVALDVALEMLEAGGA